MNDKEIREKILETLKETYDKEPHGIVMREKLLSDLKLSANELDRNIKYIEEKGLIDVEWFLDGGFFAKINSYGIDILEEIGYPLEEVEKISEYALHHIFTETKEFVDTELAVICPDALEKLRLCYEELLSGAHSHRNARIAYDCREILKDFTDTIFKEGYLPKGKKKPNRNETKNKLRYTLEAKGIKSKTTKNLLETQINYFNALSNYLQKNTHPYGFEVMKEDANNCVIYTYLMIRDVLKLLKQNENIEE
ncbi:MAG: hypothetical protein KKA79_04095 [Nanoarchaeota archaeon]|nr:hypothetical protein [Nanoarchaeota archaeon]MCG2717552.1 hypothetical protein [Nanoarchaeota archaeon]